MNHFRYVSHRISQCELKRLHSSLSVSRNEIKIPARIKRGPTDILQALERTIPKESTRNTYVYHDDPFLMPQKKIHFQSYALAYTAGKKTAKWIHQEHRNLFPKHLSEPEIKAFKPPPICTDKSQVSEELLLHTISQCNLSDALQIYKLLESNVSVGTKQMLLELLCFCNSENTVFDDHFFSRWYCNPPKKFIWQYQLEIRELFEFLIKQDSLTAAAAYNTLICGLAKHLRVDAAWQKYEECKEKDLPLNLTTYNYLLILLPSHKSFESTTLKSMFDIFKSMNDYKVKPNITTLNNALRVISLIRMENNERFATYLINEFKRVNVTPSLASYFYVMIILQKGDHDKYTKYMNLLNSIEKKSYDFQDRMDNKFFHYAMQVACTYSEKKAAEMIDNLLHVGDNYKFISDSITENGYYKSYIILMFNTSTVEEFFTFYDKVVPDLHVPPKPAFDYIVHELSNYDRAVKVQYVEKLWRQANTYYFVDLPLKFNLIKLMKANLLLNDSPSTATFADAAWNCWNHIKKEINSDQGLQDIIETTIINCIAILLLHAGRKTESTEILSYLVEKSDSFIPTLTEKQLKELFDINISNECIQGAFLVLEYSINLGFEDVIENAIKLHNHPQFTNADRNRLINLVGTKVVQVLHTMN